MTKEQRSFNPITKVSKMNYYSLNNKNVYYNGDFIPFPNQFYDPNNLFNGQSYQVPYTGLYQVKGSIALEKILLAAAPNIGRRFQVIVRRFDSSATLIQSTYGALSLGIYYQHMNMHNNLVYVNYRQCLLDNLMKKTKIKYIKK